MAAEDRPGRPRDRCYAVLPKDTVRIYAESAGLSDMSDEMADVLAEDVSYRLRDIVQQSYEFMHHCKRRKLTCDDFNVALKNSDVQLIFGESSKEAVTFQQTKEGDIFFVDDAEIDLVSIALSDATPTKLGTTTVKASWLAIEGVQTGACLQQSMAMQGKTNVTSVGRSMPTVSEDLVLYYDIVTKAILGSDSSLMKEALTNLTANTKVAPVLAYLINFVSNGVKTVSHDTAQLIRLLYTVKALVTNTSLNLHPKPYLSMLVQTITYCQLEPLPASINPLSDHWILRDYAAILLAVTTRRWNTLVNKLREQNIKLLGDILKDSSRPLCSHYGAIMGLLALGLDAVHEVMLPLLPNYIEHLLSVITDTDMSAASAVIRSDAHHVLGAILMCADYLIRADLLSTNQVPPDLAGDAPILDDSKCCKPITAELYRRLYECLGDSLAAKLPLLQIALRPRELPKGEVVPPFIADSTAGQSGEELLRQFLDPPTIDRSEKSSTRSSPISSECVDVDADMTVTVKETVSDPARGIRLTILKRPKLRHEAPGMPQPGTEMPELKPDVGQDSQWPPLDQNTSTKSRELPQSSVPSGTGSSTPRTLAKSTSSSLKQKVPLSEVFEGVVMRRRPDGDVVFVFRFQGRTQQCIAPATVRLLPRWGIGGRSTVSWYQVLCRRLPRVGRRQSSKITKPSGDGSVLSVQRTRGSQCALDLAWSIL